MSSKALAKFLQSGRVSHGHLPPTFLLPLRQNLATVSTTTHTTDPEPPPGSYIPTTNPQPPRTPIANNATAAKENLPPRYPQLSKKSALPPPTNPLSSSLALLESLASQPPHYITAHIHAKPYFLTEGDSLRLPFHMPNAPPGTTIRLNRASMLGSRDFTFRGGPWIPEEYFSCRAMVTSVDYEPERVKVKKKQRNRRTKTVRSQMRLTTLRITELKVLPDAEPLEVQNPEERQAEAAEVS